MDERQAEGSRFRRQKPARVSALKNPPELLPTTRQGGARTGAEEVGGRCTEGHSGE